MRRQGYDQIAQRDAGFERLMSITACPARAPVRVGQPVADRPRGIFLARESWWTLPRDESWSPGRGSGVHTSLLKAMVTMLDFQAARWPDRPRDPPQAGNDHQTSPIPTACKSGGHLNIAGLRASTCFRRLCEASAPEPLIEDPRDFRTASEPVFEEPQGAGGRAEKAIRQATPGVA